MVFILFGNGFDMKPMLTTARSKLTAIYTAQFDETILMLGAKSGSRTVLVEKVKSPLPKFLVRGLQRGPHFLRSLLGAELVPPREIESSKLHRRLAKFINHALEKKVNFRQWNKLVAAAQTAANQRGVKAQWDELLIQAFRNQWPLETAEKGEALGRMKTLMGLMSSETVLEFSNSKIQPVNLRQAQKNETANAVKSLFRKLHDATYTECRRVFDDHLFLADPQDIPQLACCRNFAKEMNHVDLIQLFNKKIELCTPVQNLAAESDKQDVSAVELELITNATRQIGGGVLPDNVDLSVLDVRGICAKPVKQTVNNQVNEFVNQAHMATKTQIDVVEESRADQASVEMTGRRERKEINKKRQKLNGILSLIITQCQRKNADTIELEDAVRKFADTLPDIDVPALKEYLAGAWNEKASLVTNLALMTEQFSKLRDNEELLDMLDMHFISKTKKPRISMTQIWHTIVDSVPEKI